LNGYFDFRSFGMSFSSRYWTRRAFLGTAARAGIAAPIVAAFPGLAVDVRRTARLVGLDGDYGQLSDPAGVRALAERALDAARAAGAVYTDVRLTRTVSEEFAPKFTDVFMGRTPSEYTDGGGLGLGMHDDVINQDTEFYGVGVRVLIDGCWGFAASPVWSADEMPLLAAEAARQARANGRATPSRVELVPAGTASGAWRPPGVIDPFSIPPEEKAEHLRALVDFIRQTVIAPERYLEHQLGGLYLITLRRQEWALATSDGTFCTQQRFTSDSRIGTLDKFFGSDGLTTRTGYVESVSPDDGLTAQGWERYDFTATKRRLETTIADVGHEPSFGEIQPVDVGRGTVVCSASVAAQLLGQVLAPATQLDRALGSEANARGTSFLSDPLGMLGQLRLGTSELTVTGNRSMPGGMASVKWDDEGVEPADIPLITKGVLTDFQTTRENAATLAPYYAARGRAVRSNGCIGGEDALRFPITQPPNLVMQPGRENLGLDALIKDVKKGVALVSGFLDVDFQGATGVFRAPDRGTDPRAMAREIVDGKLGRPIARVGLLFSAEKLWTNLIGIGGAGSVQSIVNAYTKGQPEQTAYATVSAVPCTIKDASIIDWGR